MSDRERLAILGQGYVGLPLAMRAVAVGFDVVGLDVDQERVDGLRAGRSHVGDVDASSVVAALESGRYHPTTDQADLTGFDHAVISVPTPLRDGEPDLSYIEGAAAMVAPHVSSGCTVVLESTTYPGTTEELVAPILEDGSGLTAGTDFHLGYSPERINPGSPTETLVGTPKVVSGIDDASLAAVVGLYERIVDTVVPVRSTKVAELTKLLENTFRHVNIALMNELAMYANDLGINIWEAIDAATTKPFGYMRFTPGPGAGGHCLPIDPSYLLWQTRRDLGRSFRFVELANQVNDAMPAYVVRRIVAHIERTGVDLQDASVLVLGLAYKPNTGDARESPALDVAARLVELGVDVRAADTHVAIDAVPASVRRVPATPDEAAAVDLVVIAVAHDGVDYAAIVAAARHVLDCQRVVDDDDVELL